MTELESASGVCDQDAIVLADGAGCSETDGNQCTTAACNGAGTCDQNFFVRNCTPPQARNPVQRRVSVISG